MRWSATPRRAAIRVCFCVLKEVQTYPGQERHSRPEAALPLADLLLVRQRCEPSEAERDRAEDEDARLPRRTGERTRSRCFDILEREEGAERAGEGACDALDGLRVRHALEEVESEAEESGTGWENGGEDEGEVGDVEDVGEGASGGGGRGGRRG